MYQREFRLAEQALAKRQGRTSPFAKSDREHAADAIEAQLSNPAAALMFAKALLAAGRLEEGIEESRRVGVSIPSDVLRSYGDQFLAEGDFDRASAYYRAAGSEIPHDGFLRYWPAFLARTDSVEAILFYSENLRLPLPTARLNAIGDRVLAAAATIDYVQLTYAFWAYKSTGAAEKLVQLGDRCRSRNARDRETIELVVAMYEAAGATNRLIDVAHEIGPWADLGCLRTIFAKAGRDASPNEIIAFGRMKERSGKFAEAIEAYAIVGAIAQLQDLAQNVIEHEHSTTGRVDLSPEVREIAMKAFNAVVSLEERQAA